jgi:hypothetical protein
VCAALLQLPDAVADPAESTLGLRLPFAGQVAGFTEREMHAFVEVVAGFAVAADHLVGDDLAQELSRLVQELLVLVGQCNA